MQTAVKNAWHYGSGMTTMAQLKAYNRAVNAALSRFDTNIRSGTYPADVQADLRILLQRLSSAMVLSYDVTQATTYAEASQYHERGNAAWDTMVAAAQVVGKDLGLTYGP